VRLFRQFILRRLTTERMRTAVAVGGIALGVAVVLAIRLANQSSVSGFASALDAMSGAASLEIVALLVKDGLQKSDLDIKYVGFQIPPTFVVGYGLDVAERYRNLPDVVEYNGKPE